MCKYISQIIYFPSILSLVFVLSHAKLKETNKKPVYSWVLHSINLSVWRIIHKYQNSFSLWKKLKENSQIWKALFSTGVFSRGGGGLEGLFNGEFPVGGVFFFGELFSRG